MWAYARWLLDQPHLLERLGELRDHRLVCWCHPASCHGHVLAFACDHGIEALRARVAGHHYPD